jgi:hypothetical protein
MAVTYREVEDARRVMLEAKSNLREYMDNPNNREHFRTLCDIVQTRTGEYLQALGEYGRQQYSEMTTGSGEDEAA